MLSVLFPGERKEVEWAYKKIEEKIKIVKLVKLTKHLGIAYDWKQDKFGNTYLEASMPKMIDKISEKFEKARGKKAKVCATPGTPGKTLRKNEGAMINLDAYRSIVGKIMYYATKIAPEICNGGKRVSRTFIKPWRRPWKALEGCVGYLTDQGSKALSLRKPRVLQSISDCDSDYAKDKNDRRSVSGQINTLGGMITNWTSKSQQTVSLSSSNQALRDCPQEAEFTRNLVEE
jgi:hypothetical protein